MSYQYTMSYIKFENTFMALHEMVNEGAFEESIKEMSDTEVNYRQKLVELCDKICAEHGELGEAREIVWRYEELCD